MTHFYSLGMSFSIRLWIAFMLIITFAHAQEEIENVMAFHLLENGTDEESAAFYSERLRELMLHPLDLNRVDEENLAYLFFLNSFQIKQFLDYRLTLGPFLSVLELQAIPGFTVETIQLMLPFVRVAPPTLSQKIQHVNLQSAFHGSIMSTYSRVLQIQKGYEIKDPKRLKYLGSADRLAIRLRVALNPSIQLTLNMEKDAGEPFFAYKQRLGFDHYSGSIFLKPGNKIKKLILGDYNLQFGQGLWLWTGTRYAAGEEVGQIISNPNDVIPHTGMAESKFMRGIASQLKLGNFSVSPFMAFNQYSASVQAIDEGSFVRSINYSGYHRTSTEQQKRKALNQWVGGTHLLYTKGSLKMGAGWYTMLFDQEIKPNLSNRINRFQGDKLDAISFDYQYHWKQFLFFGEAAHSLGSGFANYHGLMAGFGNKFSASISFRDYQKDYHQFLAQSFQEQSNLGNEQGVFVGLDYHPFKWLTWSNSVDRMHAPGAKFRARESSNGLRYQSQFSYRWRKKGILRLRYQFKTFEENYRADLDLVEGLAAVQRHQIRVINQLKLNETWNIANGLEYKFFKKDAEDDAHGYLFYQDLLWKNLWNRFHGNVRFAFFDIANYQSRIYTYERDVLHAFSFPAFYRKGIRFYINHRIRVFKNVDFWGKFGWSNYFNEESIGSGLDEIKGSHKSEIKFQLRYTW